MIDAYALAEEKAVKTHETVLVLAKRVESAEAMGDKPALDRAQALLDFERMLVDRMHEIAVLPPRSDS